MQARHFYSTSDLTFDSVGQGHIWHRSCEFTTVYSMLPFIYVLNSLRRNVKRTDDIS